MIYRSMPSTKKILEMAHFNSHFNTKKSKVNKKWTRFLKNKKLFDEYMVYLAGKEAIGVEPNTYKELANVCHNLNGRTYNIPNSIHRMKVDWEVVFDDLIRETIKWYNIKEVVLYMVNNGYK